MNTICDLLSGIANISALEVFDIDKMPFPTKNSIMLMADGSVRMVTKILKRKDGVFEHFVEREFSNIDSFLKMAKGTNNAKLAIENKVTIENLLSGMNYLLNLNLNYRNTESYAIKFKDGIVINGDGSGNIFVTIYNGNDMEEDEIPFDTLREFLKIIDNLTIRK